MMTDDGCSCRPVAMVARHMLVVKAAVLEAVVMVVMVVVLLALRTVMARSMVRFVRVVDIR